METHIVPIEEGVLAAIDDGLGDIFSCPKRAVEDLARLQVAQTHTNESSALPGLYMLVLKDREDPVLEIKGLSGADVVG
jgi:hypothetical protein